ncbi:MAG: hypothetical protein WBU20_19540, partial [Candidatus Acidiferrum sp.]
MKGTLIFAVLASLALCCLVPAAHGQANRQSADLLVSGATVVTMDPERHVFNDGAIAVRDDSIVAIGPSTDVLAKFAARQTIDAKGMLLIPGLINGHTHIPMV